MTHPHDRRIQAPGGRESLRREIRSGFRRAVGLTALGTAIPGAGLTQTRSRKLGWSLLLTALLAAGALAYFGLTKGLTKTAMSIVSRPGLLQVIAAAFILVGFLWCASVIMTAIQARPRRLDRARTRTLAGFTTLMVFLIAASSFKVAEYVTITKDTVVALTNNAKPGQGAQIVEGEDPWAETPRVNVLLLGSDAGVGRIGTRTDSMVVASIDTKSGRTVLISLPRSFERAPLPKSSPLRKLYPSGVFGRPECRHPPGDPCLLNSIWGDADQLKAQDPKAYAGEQSAGRFEIREVISEITGLEIDHTVVIDLKGFERLIDAMGGVDINVKLSGYGTKLPIGGHSDGRGGVVGEKGYFRPGKQHLSGNLALWYARTRAADDDTFRQARQRCVIKAVVGQVNPASMVSKYAEIARIARDSIYTDIAVENLPAFVDLVERVQNAKIVSAPLTPKQNVFAGKPDYAVVRKLVQAAINPPAPTPAPTSTSKPTGTAKPTTKPTEDPYDVC